MRRQVLAQALAVLALISATAIFLGSGLPGNQGTSTSSTTSSSASATDTVTTTTVTTSAASTTTTSTTSASSGNHTAIYQPGVDQLRSQIEQGQSGILQGAVSRAPSASFTVSQESGATVSKGSSNQTMFSGDDAASVIQETIDALKSPGEMVVIGAGEYVLSSPIVVSANLNATLSGSGWSTVVSTGPDFSGYLIGVTGSGWTIENLLVNCTGQLDNGSPGVSVTGANVTVRDVYVTGSSHGGIDMAGSGDVAAYNSAIANRNDGIIGRGSNQLIEFNLVSQTGMYNGISFVGVNNVTVSHNLVSLTNQSGIAAEPAGIGGQVTGPPCTDMTISSNIIVRPGYAGVAIYDQGANSTEIFGNTVVLPGHAGISIGGTNSGDSIYNNTVDTPAQFGVVIHGGAEPAAQITVEGNLIYNVQVGGSGVGLGGNASQTLIQNNFVNGTGDYGISLVGYNTRIEISYNHVEGTKYGIYEIKPSDYNTISGNTFASIQVQEIVTQGLHDVVTP